MKTNPFNPNEASYVAEEQDNQPDVQAAEEPGNDSFNRCSGEPAPMHNPKRFLRAVAIAAAVFSVIAYAVFCEIRHNRELYEMSRQVNSSEARARMLQEQLRVEVAREASLLAELQDRPFLSRNVQITRAIYTLPN